jgi:hypothetical protein
VRSDIVTTNERKPVIFGDGSLDHRGLAIRTACDLEAELVSLLSKFLMKTNGFAAAQAVNEFEDWGLKRLADLAFYLSFISDEDRHDIRKLGRLRDRYAHDKERKQLTEDAEMFALIEATYLYKSTPALKSIAQQQALVCVSRELSARIAEATP